MPPAETEVHSAADVNIDSDTVVKDAAGLKRNLGDVSPGRAKKSKSKDLCELCGKSFEQDSTLCTCSYSDL